MLSESALNNLPPNGCYVLAQPRKLFNGVELHLGDELPANDPVRRRPEQLKALVRQRVLALQTTTHLTEAAETRSIVPVTTHEVNPEEKELLSLSRWQLQAICKDRGLDHVGNKSQLRARLRTDLGK